MLDPGAPAPSAPGRLLDQRAEVRGDLPVAAGRATQVLLPLVLLGLAHAGQDVLLRGAGEIAR